jgi:hypothetical protein
MRIGILSGLHSVLIFGAVAIVASEPSMAADNGVRPDFSGIWTFYLEPGQSPFAGFGAPQPPLPFTPVGKARSEEYKKLLGPENANAGAYCVDYGMPLMMEQAGGYPIEFIQRPEQLTIIYEVEGETRRIYLAGQVIPPEKRIPTREGYSFGHWEGDTLVVKTTDLADGEDQAHPHSDQAEILERFSLGKDAKGSKVLFYEMTLTDPIYYTQPIVVKKKWAPLQDGYMITYRCPEEFWLSLLDTRREQLKAGKPVNARMSDVYKAYEAKE